MIVPHNYFYDIWRVAYLVQVDLPQLSVAGSATVQIPDVLNSTFISSLPRSTFSKKVCATDNKASLKLKCTTVIVVLATSCRPFH